MRKQAVRAKWFEAFENVMVEQDDFIPFSKAYNLFYDEMRNMGIKSNIATRQQFAQFTSNHFPNVEKEYRIFNRTRQVHYRWV
jgi:hypothetical protein